MHLPGDGQDPQLSVPPQPFETVPQFRPISSQASKSVSGLQPQTFGMPPPPHVLSSDEQAPQSIILPHPSFTEPQSFPSWVQVFGVQLHTFATPPPPQTFGATHDPQLRRTPQPSLTSVPQFLPSTAHVLGTQELAPHLLRPAPPQ